VWDLPGQNLDRIARWVLGGWQFSGVMQYQTGCPFTVTSGTDNSLDGIGNDRAKPTGADYNAIPKHALHARESQRSRARGASRAPVDRPRSRGGHLC
jgi:hypothetical protein